MTLPVPYDWKLGRALRAPIEKGTKECSVLFKQSLHLALKSIKDLKAHFSEFTDSIDATKVQ